MYLVGAGPGHPGLITRMGYDLLQRCDAVAYDALIPLELVASLPDRVERHYVGRRAGRHSMPQAEKNQSCRTRKSDPGSDSGRSWSGPTTCQAPIRSLTQADTDLSAAGNAATFFSRTSFPAAEKLATVRRKDSIERYIG